jgi:hypothetical protein
MNDLYLIIPYYNYFNNFYRQKNLQIFLKRYSKVNNLKIILVEGIFEKQNPLQDYSNIAWKHIKYNIPQKIWVKENLINLIIQNHLTKNAEYISWIDGDILFMDNDWVNQIILSLKQYDIIQIFNHAADLKKDNLVCFNKEDLIKTHNSYLFNLINKKLENGHTGFGWAINRKFYDKIKKLWDYNIIGSGDSITARSAGQSLSEERIFKKNSLNLIYSLKYAQEIYDYYNQFKDAKINYLNSSIVHLWHGDWDSKKYLSRHEILKKYNFDTSFLDYNPDGVIYIKNTDIIKDIEDYFINRETF